MDYTWLRPESDDSDEIMKIKLRVAQKIKELRKAFKEHINSANFSKNRAPPKDSSSFVRIATWNIREFDPKSYGYRGQEAKHYIAEIISHFDLIALQEIRSDLRPFRDVMRLLGPSWDYLATDVNTGGPGNKERMVFLFNRNKVWFRHVAGELVLPHGSKVTDPFGDRFKVQGGAHLELPAGKVLSSPIGLKTSSIRSGLTKIKEDVEIHIPEGSKVFLPPGSVLRFSKKSWVPLNDVGAIDIDTGDSPVLPEAAEIVLPPNSLVGEPRQFARTPFIASFQAGWLKINLATVHIYYGIGSAGIERRKEEIRRLTKLLSERAKKDSDSDADSFFIVLGDFNILGPGHETMESLKSNDFDIPAPLQSVPGTNVRQDKFYDQIALWTGKSRRRNNYTNIRTYRAGVFDFFDVVYRKDEEEIYRKFMSKQGSSTDYYRNYKSWRTYQMSDHLPMWIELHVDFTEEYLNEVKNDLRSRLSV